MAFHFNIILSHTQIFQVASFLQVSPLKPAHIPLIPHAQSISSSCIWNFMRVANHEAPCAIFSSLLRPPSPKSMFSVIMRELHPDKTIGKIKVLCILILVLLDSTSENKISWTKRQEVFSEFIILLVYSWVQFWLTSYPNIWILQLVQRIYLVSFCCDFF